MTRISGRRSASKSPHTNKQQEILKAMEAAARRQGFKVSAGQLRFAGLKLKGGSCLLRDRQWLILDKSQPFDELVDIYRLALSPEELADCGLAPDLLNAGPSPAVSSGRGPARPDGEPESIAAVDSLRDGSRAA